MSLRQTIKELARPSGVIAFSALGPGLGSVIALGMAYTHADALRDSGLGLAALFLIVGAIACGLTLLPTHALSLISGWAFGLPLGFAVAYLAASIGTPVGYEAGRHMVGPGIKNASSRYRRASVILEAVSRAPLGKATFLIALLRMSPVVPYGTTNYLAAATGVPLRPLWLGTLIGHGPRAGVVVALGAGLESLDSETGANPWLIGLGISATAAAVVLMGYFARRALRAAIQEPIAAAG